MKKTFIFILFTLMAFTPMAWAQFSGGTTYLENCLFDVPLLHPDRGIESRKTMIANRN